MAACVTPFPNFRILLPGRLGKIAAGRQVPRPRENDRHAIATIGSTINTNDLAKVFPVV